MEEVEVQQYIDAMRQQKTSTPISIILRFSGDAATNDRATNMNRKTMTATNVIVMSPPSESPKFPSLSHRATGNKTMRAISGIFASEGTQTTFERWRDNCNDIKCILDQNFRLPRYPDVRFLVKEAGDGKYLLEQAGLKPAHCSLSQLLLCVDICVVDVL